MNKIDVIYQEAVDRAANELLKLTPQQFREFREYGSLDTSIGNIKMTIAWWHYEFDNDLHHIFYLAERRVFLFFFTKYINGAKLENGKILLMTDIEIGNYD